ncbi:MAG: hypothetical protein FWC16_08175 [Defluviitaleaceae bacterium]|nr:hypothetical protein [Defluviitaleaceae bacterium]MCL2274888.1 hypothetical protein [Defluviitaleaceae bacterium]
MAQSLYSEHKKPVILLLILSCIITLLVFSNNVAYGASSVPTAGTIQSNAIANLGGAFSPLISMFSSPFLILTIFSGIGWGLNAGHISPDTFAVSSLLMEMPIAQLSAFSALLFLSATKLILSLFAFTKIFSDALLGKLEDYTGNALAIVGTFLVVTTATVYAAEVTTAGLGSTNIFAMILTNLLAFLISALAYVVYIVIRTMIFALDVLAFLFSPIPFTSAFFNITKTLLLSAYAFISLASPIFASMIGLILLAIAFCVFKKARRLVMYYKRIYLIPFFNALFRRGYTVPIIAEKLPRGTQESFNDIELCLEVFFMNKTTILHKKEQCYLIRNDGKNYLFKKRWFGFGKTIIIEIEGEAYIEKCFRFIRIFTDENRYIGQRKIHLVLRREHAANIEEIVNIAEFIDYNALLEERKRIKAEEKARIKQENAQKRAEEKARAKEESAQKRAENIQAIKDKLPKIKLPWKK